MIKLLQVMQGLVTIKHFDVMTLRRSESADCPAQVNEVRLYGRVYRVHPDFAWQTIRLARVARTARGYDVRPVIASAS